MDVVGISPDEQVYHLQLIDTEYSEEKEKRKEKTFSMLRFQDAIFRVVAAVLHLGNIEFAKGTEADSSEPKDERSWSHLKTVAELLKFVIIVHYFQD